MAPISLPGSAHPRSPPHSAPGGPLHLSLADCLTLCFSLSLTFYGSPLPLSNHILQQLWSWGSRHRASVPSRLVLCGYLPQLQSSSPTIHTVKS